MGVLKGVDGGCFGIRGGDFKGAETVNADGALETGFNFYLP
jgi:hypothetical protein